MLEDPEVRTVSAGPSTLAPAEPPGRTAEVVVRTPAPAAPVRMAARLVVVAEVEAAGRPQAVLAGRWPPRVPGLYGYIGC
jgi:hypothetical protein